MLTGRLKKAASKAGVSRARSLELTWSDPRTHTGLQSTGKGLRQDLIPGETWEGAKEAGLEAWRRPGVRGQDHLSPRELEGVVLITLDPVKMRGLCVVSKGPDTALHQRTASG